MPNEQAQTDWQKEFQQRREEEAKRLRAREDICMEQLVGDEIRVRCHGYKTMAVATLEVRETHPSDIKWMEARGQEVQRWQVWYKWAGRRTQRQGVKSTRRLDVKTENGWRIVWDDGTDDIYSWDRDRLRLPKAPQWRSGTIG